MTGILLQSTAEQIAQLQSALNMTWILVVSFLIFFMHAGFAMLESGPVEERREPADEEPPDLGGRRHGLLPDRDRIRRPGKRW
jgi:hypothetical protein